MKRYFLLIVPLVMLLSACSLWRKTPVSEQPSTVTYSLGTDKALNPNLSGQATPLQVQVFQLKDDSMFLSSDYEQLVKDPKKALMSNYIDQDDYVLAPTSFKYIEAFKLDEKTHFIGVMGRYSNLNQSQWKKVIRVEPLGHIYHLMFFFTKDEIELSKTE